jgi:hypothetical protein
LVYLGVNAAALALWLGLPGHAATAARVRDGVEERRCGLEAAGRQLNCWDQLTLAEAHLLLGEWDSAALRYREAHERFPKWASALEVACGQAEQDLIALGRADLTASICPG